MFKLSSGRQQRRKEKLANDSETRFPKYEKECYKIKYNDIKNAIYYSKVSCGKEGDVERTGVFDVRECSCGKEPQSGQRESTAG